MCYKIKKKEIIKEIHMALEHILALRKWLMHEWVNMLCDYHMVSTQWGLI